MVNLKLGNRNLGILIKDLLFFSQVALSLSPIASPIRSSMTVNSSEYPLEVCNFVASKYLAASSVLKKYLSTKSTETNHTEVLLS